MSPWNFVEQKSVMIKGKENFLYNLYGIQQLDYLDLFKKFAANTYGAQESYRLDFIAEVVLGQNKLTFNSVKAAHTLLESSDGVTVDESIPPENLHYFERFVRLKQKIKAELELRKSSNHV
jgi:hypothetical protein